MPQRIFIKVVGFTDAEREALDAALQAGDPQVAYAVWAADAPSVAHMAVLDADVPGAADEAEAARTAAAVVAWVGEDAPAHAWRSYLRPLDWSELLRDADELFAPEPDELDLDLAIDEEPDTEPGTLPDLALEIPDIPLDDDEEATRPPQPAAPVRRALIASPSLEERLYLRAKLALAGVTQADEAATPSQALEMMHVRHYEIVWLDLALDGARPWDLLRQAAGCHPDRLIATKPSVSWLERRRARALGARELMPKPLDPVELQALLMDGA